MTRASFSCTSCGRSWQAPVADVVAKKAKGSKCQLCGGVLRFPDDLPAPPAAPARSVPTRCRLCERGVARPGPSGVAECSVCSAPLTADGALRFDLAAPPRATAGDARATRAAATDPAGVQLARAALIARAERDLLSRADLAATWAMVTRLADPQPWVGSPASQLPVPLAEALALGRFVLFFGARPAGATELEVPVPEQRDEERGQGSLLEVARDLLEDEAPVLGFFEVKDSATQVTARVSFLPIDAQSTQLNVAVSEERNLRTNVAETVGRLGALRALPQQVARGIAERRADLLAYAVRCAVLGVHGGPAARATPSGLRQVLRTLGLPEDPAPLAMTSGPILLTV